MNVAITGGAGFIGQRLCFALSAAGYQVRALTRSQPAQLPVIDGIQWIQGDLTTDSNLSCLVQGADVLFHCAGEIADKSRMQQLHVQGTRNLIAAAAGRVSRWVQLSSTGVYGPRRIGQVLEVSPPEPHGVYETTKAASDELILEAAFKGHFSHTILRPSIVFGKGMPNQSLFSMLRMIEQRLFCYIGRPGASANYVHVKNVVDALMLCGFHEKAAGETFNLSDHTSMENFAQLMARQLGVSEPRLRLPETPTRLFATLMQSVRGWPLTSSRVDALTSFVTYPITKIEDLMSFRHKVSISDGITDLVQDYRERQP